MHQLGDQWVEIIDGQEHMVKAIEPFWLCQGCLFNCNQGGCCWKGFDSCHMGSYFIIKDLGIMKDGMLQCPFCVEYPIVKMHDSHWDNEGVKFYIQHIHYPALLHETKQEAIDAWNRRS